MFAVTVISSKNEKEKSNGKGLVNEVYHSQLAARHAIAKMFS